MITIIPSRNRFFSHIRPDFYCVVYSASFSDSPLTGHKKKKTTAKSMPMQHVDGRQTDAFRSPFLSPFSFETRINTFKLHAEAAYWLYQSYDNKLWSVAFVDSHQVFVLSLTLCVCVTSQCQICVSMLICVVAKPSTIALYNISHAMWAEYISNKTNKFCHQNFEYFQVVCFRCSNWHWR